MIGLVGAGNMATALARGWGDPVLCTDAIPQKAEALAAETGGRAVQGNGQLADEADLVILAHKPAQLHEVAEQLGGRAKGVVSILGGVPLADVKAAYGATPAVRVIPSVPVEVGQGVTCHARDPEADADFERRVLELFGRVGPVVTVDDAQMSAATAVMSCAPAFWALVAEAQVDAAVRAGIPADVAGDLVVGTMAGTGTLLGARDNDTLGVRRQVTSPGGITAKAVAALERHSVRAAFDDAVQAVVNR